MFDRTNPELILPLRISVSNVVNLGGLVPDVDLTQEGADQLIAMEKVRGDDQQLYFPASGDSICAPLTSLDQKDVFLLDVRRESINLSKATYQNRSRKVMVLVRLDMEGNPHRNPDGAEIPTPHLQVFREGYGDK